MLYCNINFFLSHMKTIKTILIKMLGVIQGQIFIGFFIVHHPYYFVDIELVLKFEFDQKILNRI